MAEPERARTINILSFMDHPSVMQIFNWAVEMEESSRQNVREWLESIPVSFSKMLPKASKKPHWFCTRYLRYVKD